VRFQTLALSDIGISSITKAELEYGVCKSQQQEKNRSALMQFFYPTRNRGFQRLRTAIQPVKVELEDSSQKQFIRQ